MPPTARREVPSAHGSRGSSRRFARQSPSFGWLIVLLFASPCSAAQEDPLPKEHRPPIVRYCALKMRISRHHAVVGPLCTEKNVEAVSDRDCESTFLSNSTLREARRRRRLPQKPETDDWPVEQDRESAHGGASGPRGRPTWLTWRFLPLDVYYGLSRISRVPHRSHGLAMSEIRTDWLTGTDGHFGRTPGGASERVCSGGVCRGAIGCRRPLPFLPGPGIDHAAGRLHEVGRRWPVGKSASCPTSFRPLPSMRRRPPVPTR